MIRRRRNREAATADVVAALQEQVRQAQALAAVPEQELLRDPRLNPATRALADSLEAERLRARLEAEHRRAPRPAGANVRQWRRSARPRLWMPRALPRTRADRAVGGAFPPPVQRSRLAASARALGRSGMGWRPPYSATGRPPYRHGATWRRSR